MLPTDVLVVNPECFGVCFLPMKRKNTAAVALGRIKTAKKTAASAKNARRATRLRMAQQTPEERTAQAKAAAAARWGKKR